MTCRSAASAKVAFERSTAARLPGRPAGALDDDPRHPMDRWPLRLARDLHLHSQVSAI